MGRLMVFYPEEIQLWKFARLWRRVSQSPPKGGSLPTFLSVTPRMLSCFIRQMVDPAPLWPVQRCYPSRRVPWLLSYPVTSAMAFRVVLHNFARGFYVPSGREEISQGKFNRKTNFESFHCFNEKILTYQRPSSVTASNDTIKSLIKS